MHVAKRIVFICVEDLEAEELHAFRLRAVEVVLLLLTIALWQGRDAPTGCLSHIQHCPGIIFSLLAQEYPILGSSVGVAAIVACSGERVIKGTDGEVGLELYKEAFLAAIVDGSIFSPTFAIVFSIT